MSITWTIALKRRFYWVAWPPPNEWRAPSTLFVAPRFRQDRTLIPGLLTRQARDWSRRALLITHHFVISSYKHISCSITWRKRWGILFNSSSARWFVLMLRYAPLSPGSNVPILLEAAWQGHQWQNPEVLANDYRHWNIKHGDFVYLQLATLTKPVYCQRKLDYSWKLWSQLPRVSFQGHHTSMERWWQNLNGLDKHILLVNNARCSVFIRLSIPKDVFIVESLSSLQPDVRFLSSLLGSEIFISSSICSTTFLSRDAKLSFLSITLSVNTTALNSVLPVLLSTSTSSARTSRRGGILCFTFSHPSVLLLARDLRKKALTRKYFNFVKAAREAGGEDSGFAFSPWSAQQFALLHNRLYLKVILSKQAWTGLSASTKSAAKLCLCECDLLHAYKGR